jgi:putative hydrolase of the HAD superfamily
MASFQPQALLFDLGGVLIDIDFRRAFAAWAQAAGGPAAALAERFVFDATYHAYERGEIGEAEYFASLRPMLGISIADEAFLAGWNAIFVGARPGVEAMLARLAGRFPLYVFSNTSRAHKRYFLARYAALLAPVREVFCSCDIGLRKPTAEAYSDVCRRVGAPAESIAFFDDLAENVRGARSAGLRAYQVHADEATPQVLARSLW